MPIIKPDFSEAMTFETIPAGDYCVRILGCEQRVGKTSGKPYLAWTLEIFNSSESRFNGRKIWSNTSFMGKGAGVFKTMVEAITGKTDSSAIDTDHFIGKEIIAHVEHENDPKGELRETVNYFKAMGNTAASSEPFTESDIPF